MTTTPAKNLRSRSGIYHFLLFYKEGNPEDPASYVGGYPAVEGYSNRPGFLFAPASPRTTAEEYEKGKYKYQYNGQGGQSWTIPYVAGVLALGWQVKPDYSPEHCNAARSI